ncbi:MAG: EI24 domain-containing protein [Rhodospirillales bacterium]|nr:EI24 domain-containing protein [Rhodospirillales bacterium]
MLIPAFFRSVAQLTDRQIVKTLFMAVLVALGIFVAATALVWSLTALIPSTGYGWIDSWLDPLIDLSVPVAMLFAGWFLFPALVTIGLSFFLEDVMDAVESKHYPKRPARRQVGFMEDLWVGIRLLAAMVAINILILPIYVILLITGIGAPLLYLGVNAYLLGREYFELVAIRHMPRTEMEGRRKERSLLNFLAGLLIAGLFFVPFVNLLAPIVAAALMVHIVQKRALPPQRG